MSYGRKLFITVMIFQVSVAAACPDRLHGMNSNHLADTTLCSIFDQFERSKAALEAKGFVPAARVGNLRAPRFINMPYWRKKRDRTRDAARRAYEPAPSTWQSWDLAAGAIDDQAKKNFESQHIPSVDLSWLINLQASSVRGIKGELTQFRANQEIGLALKRPKALTLDQVRAVNEFTYPQVAAPAAGLTHFVATACLEDQPVPFQSQFSSSDRPSIHLADWMPPGGAKPFVDEKGSSRQCGLIMYAPASETILQIYAWIKFFNAGVAKLNASEPTDLDLIKFAARAQRWLIAIHPFPGGNGRTSRLIMDYVFESVGLPAPLLADMDDDLYTSEAKWADEVGRGLRRSVDAAQTCVHRPDARGCSIIPGPGASEPATRLSEVK